MVDEIEINWHNRLMVDAYYGDTADLTYEELYQAFKERLLKEMKDEK